MTTPEPDDALARDVLGRLKSGPYPGSQTWDEAVDSIAAALRAAREAGADEENAACAAIVAAEAERHRGNAAESWKQGMREDCREEERRADDLDELVAAIRARRKPC